MKDKILKISALFFIFLISVGIIYSCKKPAKYKVLEVIEADELIVDFNHDEKINKNENIKLKGVSSFKSFKTNENFSDIGISKEEALKLGYLAKSWAKENLLNKEVYIYNKNTCLKNETCYVDIIYNEENYAKFLLKNGLAYPSKTPESKIYHSFLNFKEIKNNIIEISKLNFYILNLNSATLHKPNCKHAKESSKVEIVLKKDINDKNIIYCKKCFNNYLEKHLSKIKIPKPNGIYKKSVTKSFQNIDLYLINPLEYNTPSQNCRSEFCKRLISEIDNTKNSIDIALYDFGEQKEIFSALINAKNRGVNIRAVSNLSKNEDLTHSLKPEFIKEFNAILDNTDSLMHNKFFIFDNNLVMSGSSNISSTGSGGYNANSVVFIKDELIAQRFKKEFNQMHDSKFSKNKKLVSTQNSDIEAYFSPKDDIYNRILSNLIKNASKNIYISAFYLTDNQFINELISAKNRGIEVITILDATSANNFNKKVEKLRSNNIIVAIENWGGKNHEKTIVIDDEILILGSCNFSKSGFYKNDENIIIFKKPDMAKFYKDYFLYLLNSIDKKYFISIPRAEGWDSKNSCSDGIDNNFDGKIDSDDKGCK